MKSVIFVASGLYVGGVEKALYGAMKRFIYDGWEIYVALTRPEGSNYDFLPPNCKVKIIHDFNTSRYLLSTPIRELIVHSFVYKNYVDVLKFLWQYLNIKIFKTNLKLYEYTFSIIPYISDKQFDLAVAFAGPDPFIDYYVATKINAKEKWGWIHFDISRYGVDRGIMKYAGERYTRINIVSKQAKQIFDAAFPGLSHKTFYEPNIIDEDNILKLSKEPLNISQFGAKTVLLTVGRISEEKGQFIALEAISKMVKFGMRDFIWLFVGDGIDMAGCKQRVNDLGLNGYVKFLGVKSNPYPYMANCDIYVQPSLHEGFCITLAEAKLFEKPIVSTDFAGAEEQLSDYHCAIICKANDSESLSGAICQMVNNL